MSSYLWQNFLHDTSVLITMKQYVHDIVNNHTIKLCIEIWPWKGALTRFLMPLIQTYHCLEKDETFVPILNDLTVQHRELYPHGSFTVQRGDALTSNLNDILQSYGVSAEQTIVVWNIPYYITSPLIRHFFCEQTCPAWGMLLIQKEVGDKIRYDAQKKSYLRRLTNYHYQVKYIKTVRARAFRPVPKVDSCIITLSKTVVPFDHYLYWRMTTLLDHISYAKRKTLGKIRKHNNKKSQKTLLSTSEFFCFEWSWEYFYLPVDLAGHRLEECWRDDLKRIITHDPTTTISP
jgi:16S rRNA A1518/A1519 N6-dimethyltransferase RsmA/KsgA/DIM1 with predicted DNA glycosylase/AP lyase activity